MEKRRRTRYVCPECGQELNQRRKTLLIKLLNFFTFDTLKAANFQCTGCLNDFVMTSLTKWRFKEKPLKSPTNNTTPDDEDEEEEED